MPWIIGGIIFGIIMAISKSASGSKVAPSKFPLQKWATYFGVPLEVLSGLVRTESGGNPKATNLTAGDLARGGAWGLGQMTLMTAKGLVAGLKTSKPDLKPYLDRFDGTGPSLYDPDLNLLLACALLKSNYAAMKTWPGAVLAYNRGVGGARKWLLTMNADDNVYVKKVYA